MNQKIKTLLESVLILLLSVLICLWSSSMMPTELKSTVCWQI